MEWTDLKDWKVLSGIATAIAAFIAFLLKRPRETAETVNVRADAALKMAEAKKINYELNEAQAKMIDDLRLKLDKVNGLLDEANELTRQLRKELDRTTVRLRVFETFTPSLKTKKDD